MGLKILGIDISDCQVTGVVLDQQRRAPILVNALSLPLSEDGAIVPVVRQLCEQLEWREGICVCGLPLSLFSVRNLSLPFRDVKKITQALPFELEEQLIAPLDTLVSDFCVSKRSEERSLIVAFAMEKASLGTFLGELNDRIDPDKIMPAMVPLAMQVAGAYREHTNFLLIHADMHSSTMTLVVDSAPVFYRRLAYPEAMILHPPFSFAHGEVAVSDMAAAEECIRLFSRSIERSLDYFRMESGIKDAPERVVLTGPLAGMPVMADMLTACLRLPVETIDLLSRTNIVHSEEQRSQWQGWHADRALSVALQGSKKTGINFRKDALAKKGGVRSRNKQLVMAAAAAAVLVAAILVAAGYDYQRLKQRDQVLADEMTAIFKSTFPEVTKIRNPYVEMQARMKSLTGSGAPAPTVVTEQRALELLADISRRIPETLVVRVNRLSLDRQSVAIKGVTDTFNSVETIKSTLSASPRYKAVQIVSATADKDKKDGAIRFEVQMELQGI
ncbi:Fimbrial assembly family protein [Desulfobulbus propionicus DSM 2032]|uniref:Fimbrial assembly family protein n=1 Tax=Desulfobulbus propionicus (strain ATCC 33891 / DSM 2032 / VKM B-1956 / 1pr3) TaxID=577650 RepID=A0A7U4DN98_DESPD|nr:type II secretion system protein GspL [Desulfobulbus propionicus]ADW16837.1 Fimbrial assembly family protein [Desulfobulbus propionicus DSM 2032]